MKNKLMKIDWKYYDLLFLFIILDFTGFVVLHYIFSTFEPEPFSRFGLGLLVYAIGMAYFSLRLFFKIILYKEDKTLENK